VPVLRDDNERRIDKVCSYIAEHYTARVTQPEAARIAGMSVSAFSHFFKTETEASVAEIAYQSGFNNLANFNRRFADLKQVSPKGYRSQYTAHIA
jgi:AraC-like DNA-binding protein